MLFVEARAKINWTLDVLDRRADGYHELDMLMQSVALHDTLWMEQADTLTLEAAGDENDALSRAIASDSMSSQAVRYDDSNLTLRAARALLAHRGVQKGARIRLLKRIPSGAGMGGGSADAAATLRGLNELWRLGLSHAELCEIGLTLGADVPFMLTGGLARVGGLGEKITPLHPAPLVWLVVVQPCDGLSTKEIFGAYDALSPANAARPHTDAAQSALLAGDLRALGAAMDNALEAVSARFRPEIGAAILAMESAGAIRAMMTGSGSAVYGVFDCESSAESAREALCGAYPNAVATHTAGLG